MPTDHLFSSRSPADEMSSEVPPTMPPAPATGGGSHRTDTAAWLVVLTFIAGALWLTRPQALVKTPDSVRRTQSCLSNLSRIATAFAQYANDYDGKFPRGVDPEDRYNPDTWGASYGRIFQRDAKTVPMLHNLLFFYLGTREVWHCPDDSGWQETSGLPGFESGLSNVKPSSYAKYGTSYYYLTLRGFAGMTADDFSEPGRSISLFDGDVWHRLQGQPSVNALFVDGHVQNLEVSRFEVLMRSGYNPP
jgi:prepilin-type processing-associated H-X9-DG protein